MSTKELALDTIQGLPEDASWQDTEERIRFVAAIERARREVREGKVVPQEEVRALSEEWISE
jgi:hypothetical protein